MHFNLLEILPTIGYFGIAAILFAETGLMVGFFLPGDSMLFTAGFLASQHILNIWILAPLCFISAVAGNSTGYFIGKQFGKKLFRKEDSLLFHKDHLKRAEKFYERYGKKTVVLAQFLPVLRTFAPVVAGIGDMHYPTFITFNIIGALFWAVGVTFGGFFLGKIIPAEQVDKYLIPIILIIIIASIAPSAYHVLKEKENRENIKKIVKQLLSKKSK